MMEFTLRKWRREDNEALVKLCSGADRTFLSGRLPYPYTEEHAAWWLGHASDEEDGGNGVFRAVCVDGQPVGNITVERRTDVYFRDGELGYLLDKAYWGKGIITKAVHLICDEAFANMDLLRITAYCYAPNVPSRKILEKNDFQLEGLMRKGAVKFDNIYDLCIYGKLREEHLHE